MRTVDDDVSSSANWMPIAKKRKRKEKVCCYHITNGLAPRDVCQTAQMNLFMWNTAEDADKEQNVTDCE